jgi:hypothetical protein
MCFLDLIFLIVLKFLRKIFKPAHHEYLGIFWDILCQGVVADVSSAGMLVF